MSEASTTHHGAHEPEPELGTLRKLKAQLAAAQELARIGSWEWDIAANRVSWSTELHRIWGTDPHDPDPLTFESYLAKLHAEDRERARTLIEAAFRAGAPFEFEHRIERADGVRTIHSRGEVVCDERGQPVAMRGTAQDVTEQQELVAQRLEIARAEAAREAAERAATRFRFLAEASEQLAASLDYEQTLRNVAKLAVPRFADWAAVDVLAQDRAVRRLAVEHADPERVSLVAQLAERYPTPPDAAFGVAHVLRTARPELAEDIPADLLRTSARDPEHLRMLEALGLRSYAIVPLVVDERVLGALTFAQAESGRRFTPDDLPFLEDLARRAAVAMHNAQLVTELAEAHAQLAGQADELEMQAAELEETMAELEHRNEELQVLHEEAVEAREMAERANEAKSQFLASMSHELRTPLNAIAGYSELLELGIPGALNPEQLEIVNRIQRNERRLLGMINDVLNFTKLTSTKLQFPLGRVPVSPLVEELEALIAPQLQSKQLRLERERPRADMAMHANQERVEQILLNLLTNAVKFTPASGCVRVSCTEGEGQVRIHVRDTGRGIPAEEREAIFEPFVQVEPEPARENAGVGLGLAIGRELARAMGGDITVESELGRGSCFTLSLPAANAGEGPPLAVLG